MTAPARTGAGETRVQANPGNRGTWALSRVEGDRAEIIGLIF